jgi:hypothetical protein
MEGECGVYGRYVKNMQGLGLASKMSVTVQLKKVESQCGPEGSRRFRLPDFHDIQHMEVVRSSAPRTGRLYPQECSWY